MLDTIALLYRWDTDIQKGEQFPQDLGTYWHLVVGDLMSPEHQAELGLKAKWGKQATESHNAGDSWLCLKTTIKDGGERHRNGKINK